MPFAGKAAPVSRKDMAIKARDGVDIPVRIFNADLPVGPALIWYPGCGYLLPVFELNAIAASRIAFASGIKVIIVDHRLAPEAPLPKPIEDAYDVAKYFYQHAGEFHINQAEFFVGGISSGAHCALTVSQWARADSQLEVCGQILVNGNYDFTRSHKLFSEFEQQDMLMPQAAIVDQIKRLGLSKQQAVLLSPLLTPDFCGLPSTTIIVSEFDAVRSDSEQLAYLLDQAEVDISKMLVEGQTHNTMLLRDALHEGVDVAAMIAETLEAQCYQSPRAKL
jgi:acetyl esterase